MNSVSRMRNAGDAPKLCTTLEPIPLSNAGGGTHIGDRPTFLPAFLISLVFRFAEHLRRDRCIQANRKLDSFSPGEAIPEIECLRLQSKYTFFDILKNRRTGWCGGLFVSFGEMKNGFLQ